jgi:hypothetical protein
MIGYYILGALISSIVAFLLTFIIIKISQGGMGGGSLMEHGFIVAIFVALLTLAAPIGLLMFNPTLVNTLAKQINEMVPFKMPTQPVQKIQTPKK